jgi:hypothetical protein
MSGDVPSFQEFDPNLVPWQIKALTEIENFDYSKGVLECLFSGTVGSAKSLLGSHMGIRHVVEHEKSRLLCGRITRPDLKDTLIQTIDDHIEGDFVEGVDYEKNETSLKYTFYNGSEIISRSWHKKNWLQFRSLKLSGVLVEELTENVGDYWEHWSAIKQRVGRLPHVKKNFMCAMTNPDSPEHPAYKYFIASKHPNRKVFYSDARENPFLPEWYIKNLMNDLSPLEVERMIKGQWVADPKGGIYHNYHPDKNYRDEHYIFNLAYPIDFFCDYNIGHSKPMSTGVGQYIDGVFHVAKTFIIDGADTPDMLDEIENSGILDKDTWFRVMGDASGKNRDTRSKTSDYELWDDFLARYRVKSGDREGRRINYEMCVPKANPPIRTRHNKVNAKCENAFGKVQLYVYKDAPEANTGFQLTKLKKGGNYIEDDSMREQHITTAIGYWLHWLLTGENRKSKTIQL